MKIKFALLVILVAFVAMLVVVPVTVEAMPSYVPVKVLPVIIKLLPPVKP